MILDTSFLIDLFKNKPEALRKAQELDKTSQPIRTTSITVFELWQGLEDLQNPIKRNRMEQFLNSQGLLQFDIESAKKAGIIYAQLERRGEIIEEGDCMIAGIALHHNEPLLTRNTKHFQRIKGLKVVTY